MCQPVSLEEISVILLDIEGTTTSISFVKDVLFPYARQHVDSYLKEHWDDPSTAALLQDFRTQSQKDAEINLEGVVAIPDKDVDSEVLRKALVSNILWQMDADRKATPLKKLQGMIWAQGYKDGHLKAHLYEDVLPCLEQWHKLGKRLCIYSSGSIQAQKLLFDHTTKGSILEMLSGYFDTTTGGKTEEGSYHKIALALECKPRQILFLTDVPKEAEAAKGSGMHTTLVIRPGNAPLLEQDFQLFSTIHSFEELK